MISVNMAWTRKTQKFNSVISRMARELDTTEIMCWHQMSAVCCSYIPKSSSQRAACVGKDMQSWHGDSVVWKKTGSKHDKYSGRYKEGERCTGAPGELRIHWTEYQSGASELKLRDDRGRPTLVGAHCNHPIKPQVSLGLALLLKTHHL